MAIYTKEKEKTISGNSFLISVPKTYELCALTVEFTKSRFEKSLMWDVTDILHQNIESKICQK